MVQLHNKFTDSQVKELIERYLKMKYGTSLNIQITLEGQYRASHLTL